MKKPHAGAAHVSTVQEISTQHWLNVSQRSQKKITMLCYAMFGFVFFAKDKIHYLRHRGAIMDTSRSNDVWTMTDPDHRACRVKPQLCQSMAYRIQLSPNMSNPTLPLSSTEALDFVDQGCILRSVQADVLYH
jgi:hypothetical protein